MAKSIIRSKVKTIDTDKGRLVILGQVELLKKKPYVKWGWIVEGKGTDKHGESDLTNATIAAIHEFGAPKANVPERSHMRSSFDDNRPALVKTTRFLAGKVLDGRITVSKALDILGLIGLTNLQKKIRSGIPPPLSQRTLDQRAAKGDANPTALIDTAEMVNSSTFAKIMSGRRT